MNRLFIIGNGFDLAHGLPTSYGHFLNSFWKNLKDDYSDPLLSEIVYIDPSNAGFFDFGEIIDFKSFAKNINKYSREYGLTYNPYELILKGSSGFVFLFKNEFFKRINRINSINNWVDVENEYYNQLKNIAFDDSIEQNRKKAVIVRLNSEFEQVRRLLVRYLQNEVVEKYDFNWKINEEWETVLDILKPIAIRDSDKSLAEEFQFKEDKNELLKLIYKKMTNLNVRWRAHFLVFNYTPTIEFYINKLIKDGHNSVTNYIHGSLEDNREDSIVFGFGDEIDEDYKKIENMGDNDFLKNFKSFSYSQNNSYKSLFDFIDSGQFQTVIVGHSCGLSDRVLLNSIFEHENCRSIKPIYHSAEGNDNYTELIQNISRHFNDKSIMRRKIVNKTLTSAMPQVKMDQVPD